MGVFGDILLSLGSWGASVVAFGSLIGLWLLTGGLEWCRRQMKFMFSAAQMPGPLALPIIGNAFHFACSYNELLNRLVQMFKPYEVPFRVWMGPKLFVAIRNPRDIEVVLNSAVATKKPYEYRFLATYLGHGLVSDSGATHRAHRKLIMPMVNGKNLSIFMQDSFDKHSRRCVRRLESRIDTGEFDIIHFMDDCTLDMVLETIMGTPGTAQDNGYEGLINCSSQAIGLAYERTLKIWLYFDWIYTRTNSGKLFAKAMGVLHEFAETIITRKKVERVTQLSCSPESSDKPLTAVLDRLIAWNAQTNGMDDKRLRDEIANVWLPAQDPTALVSSFLFVMLGMHPEVQDRVRAEVREVLGDGDITVEKISKLQYLEMVFKETVRLFPVGPVILREPSADLDFDACTAPKGCTIAIFVFMTHRDPKYWKEPEIFNPERFTPENSAGRPPCAFIPFSGGIRGCIGRQYATVLVKTLVARVVQKYRISSSGSLKTLRLKSGVSIRSVDGYKISITRV